MEPGVCGGQREQGPCVQPCHAQEQRTKVRAAEGGSPRQAPTESGASDFPWLVTGVLQKCHPRDETALDSMGALGQQTGVLSEVGPAPDHFPHFAPVCKGAGVGPTP